MRITCEIEFTTGLWCYLLQSPTSKDILVIRMQVFAYNYGLGFWRWYRVSRVGVG